MSNADLTCASGHKVTQQGCLDCLELAMKFDAFVKESQHETARVVADAERRLGREPSQVEKAVLEQAIRTVAAALHVANKAAIEALREFQNEKPDPSLVHQHMESAKMATDIAQALDRLADKVLAR